MAQTTDGPARKRRANGEESRRRILDAAAEIAGERGYEGASIALVSARCGLPASSIYWHFKDKDDLIAAVIERSFGTWLAAIALPEDGGVAERGIGLALQVARALSESPDFLRLGLMLALERRPQEPRARQMFLEVRAQGVTRVAGYLRTLAPHASEEAVRMLTTYAMAGADGLFIAHEIGGDGIDLRELFTMHARAIVLLADELGAAR